MLRNIKFSLLKTFFQDATPVYKTPLCSKCNSNKLMVLLGWGGSTKGNLRKIEQFHRYNGYCTVTCTMPLFVPVPFRNYVNSKVVELIKNHVNVTNEDIFYHVYSNNGSWMYAELMQRSDQGIIPYPSKTIFDSAAYLPSDSVPWYNMVPLFSRPIVAMILKKAVYTHDILTPLIVSIMFPCALVGKILQCISGDMLIPNYSKLNNYLRNNLEIPSLFVYSTGDTLVPVADVEAFISSQIERNVTVDIWKVEDLEVQHTASFFLKNDQYSKKLNKFLES